MANIKSAKKRIDTNNRQRGENKFVKSTISTYVKGFRKLIAEGKIAEAESKLVDTISYIDSACSKGVLHKNNASRKISRLTLALNKAKQNAPVAEVKPAEKVEEVVKPVVAEEKVEAKKAPAKRTTKKAEAPAEEVKKAPAKKTTTAKKETK